MLSRILTAVALATALATAAYAANTSSGSSANTTGMNNAKNANSASETSNAQQTAQNLPQEIRAKLKDDGFTDVKVVPGSFIVSAKDKRGEPMIMMIGPNSMMMVTQATKGGTGTSTNSQTDSQK
jgi:hypothetical protein